MAEWRPSPVPILKFPEIDPMVPAIDLEFPEQEPRRSTWLERFSAGMADRPLEAPDSRNMPSPLAAFLMQFGTSAANSMGDRYRREQEGNTGSPANRLALSRLNLERQKADKARSDQDSENRIKAAQAASRGMNERKKELREEAREAAAKLKELEQDADTPEGLAKIQREVRRLSVTREELRAAGVPLPAALREPKAEKAAMDPRAQAERNVTRAAAADSIRSARDLNKPPKAYVTDKLALARRAGMDAQQFEDDVRANAEKLRGAGFSPDSLIEKGWRYLPKPENK